MNSQKSINPIVPRALPGFAQHVNRNLSFRIAPNAIHAILDGSDISRVEMLDHFVQLVLERSQAPFFINKAMHRGRDGEEGYGVPNSSDPVARELASRLTVLMSAIGALYPSNPNPHRLCSAPHLELLWNTFLEHPIRVYQGDSSIFMRNGRVRLDAAEQYNDFIALLRQRLTEERQLKSSLHNWSWGSRENVANLKIYLDNLFDKYGSVTVLHLRLSAATTPIGVKSTSVDESQYYFDLLRKSRACFFDRIRRKPALFTNEPEYVWSIIPLVDGTYELHLTLLFSTVALQKVLDDKRVEANLTGTPCANHADQVGAYWIAVGTEGRGSYRQSDQIPGVYDPDVWVHGVIHADETSRRKSLVDALSYLALRRTLIRLASEPLGKYFGFPERKPRRSRRSAGGRANSAG
ncbi:hypothetical protein BLA9940_04451 [Burkholderia aenigmatica]|uniref:hypothetical protein n=1 Tax=Burkholderia aenigmatica TaxID=2015348 RepID=UPI0014530EDF|nr:hypothetical protein [Burkholderia aenigmatica]VWC75920.1 hypothetical protein BLA9940_04451 [Burkholderia aenigmatica]